VRRSAILDGLSKRAPAIVVFTLSAALVGEWIGAPAWLPKGLAIVVGSLALLLMAARGRTRQLGTGEGPGFDSNRSWLDYELSGQGTPSGFYSLGFFGVVTIVLTGMQSPYSLPAWAGLGLNIAWGFANARYPVDEE
jgi:hypothetical protein